MASHLLVDEACKEGPLNSSADDHEAPASAEESTPGGDQATPKKKGGKRRMEEEEGVEGKKKRVASLDRPSRERKSVERYAALSPIRVSATKALAIQQGSGEKLKDIPNVAFKLSKRKADESLRVLHKILFGRKATVHFLKRNILQFSGFVWSQNEEKDRLKIKEKINKCNKDRLLDLSDLLDLYTLKVNTKKEDISATLMEFLESPHVTREVVLSEKIKKGKKLKRGVKRTGERTHDEASTDKEKKREKRQRKELANDDKEDDVDSIEKDDESAGEDESADAEETSENSKGETEIGEDGHKPELAKKSSDEEGTDEPEELESKQHSFAVRKASCGTPKKGSSSSKTKAESKSKVSSESKACISKDTKRSSNTSKTSKKGLSLFKKKADTEGKSKVNSESKAGISKDTKESSNMSVTSKKGFSSSKKKVDIEGESRAKSSKDTKSSTRMKKDEVPIKIDSKDNSKRRASMKSDIFKKAVKKKGKSNVGTASKDMTGSNKGAKQESNNAEKQGKKKGLSVVPTTKQLSAVVSEILKEVDFNVATLADIIRQLGARFDIDLMDRKAEIKHILEEVINNMTDDEEVEDEDGNGDEEAEKN